MASIPTDDGSVKPRLHQTRSFTRMESSDMTSPFTRTRAKTVQSMASPEIVNPDSHPIALVDEEENAGRDVFEKRDSSDSGVGDEGQQGDEASILSRSTQDQPEELPVELASLTDRFINSLTAKVHSSPPTIDRISMLFQDFYTRAESHIATHISALASRINREPSPQPPPKTRGSGQSNKSAQDLTSSRQMLTASEVAEKRKARKYLAYKRVALEEAVERRACEGIYDKIWRHKSTLDEVRDEKLRSKTAAFMLVGINLKDLGIDIDLDAIEEQKQKEADDCLSVARECLAKMNDEKYPLGKLQHLAAAHKAIVDALTKLLPSSSSADEILPTLIYSLITCPPDGINIISNLLFIQRFRSSSKMDGETAYCLTNLEAAVCFLENVDLSSLRGEESQDGQSKPASSTTTPSGEHSDPFRVTKETAQTSVSAVSATPEILKSNSNEPASDTLPRPQQPQSIQQRRPGLNNLFQPPSKVLGAANDAVRNTADQSLKNIGASLDSSLNFFFGRLKELQPGNDGGSPVLPKTLAEARRLVTTPSSGDTKAPASDYSAPKEPSFLDRPLMRHATSRAEDLFGGRSPRDRSVDSVRTQGSSKKSITGSSSIKDGTSPGHSQMSPLTPSSSTPTPLESVRNFGNTLNPLNHIPGMIKSFGRSAPDTPGGPVSLAASEKSRAPPAPAVPEGPPATPSTAAKVDPPIQRFLDAKNANDLTIRDVTTLLEDYKRLATSFFKPGPRSG